MYPPTDADHVQVLLVAGGYANGDLSSTEILVTLAGEWRTVGGLLPTAVSGLRGGTLDNTVYMTGEWCTDIYTVMVCWHLMFQEEGMMVTVHIMTPSSATAQTRSSGTQPAA